MKSEISKESIKEFLDGKNPMEHVVNIECGYQDSEVSLIVRDGDKRILMTDDFKPFCWVKYNACIRMYKGDKQKLKWALNKTGIRIKALRVTDDKGKGVERLENGFRYLFYSTKKMSYSEFMKFFEYAGTPIYPKQNKSQTDNYDLREFFTVSPIEQYMISTGIRLFKGYENYNDLKRLIFDLETQGLDPHRHRIDLNGVRTNKGFEKIIAVEGETEEEKNASELQSIREFIRCIYQEQPDVILGYNSENFDWNFIIERLHILGSSLEAETKNIFAQPIYKKNKETVLKLGGEVEYYRPTVMWGTTMLDALHAVRRAQAIDSNMKSANLKEVTKYAKLNKRNRVYIPGDKISTLWKKYDEKEYAFNNENGKWYKINEENPLKEGFKYSTGHYIVERYNLDDIWETDKVDLRFNESNFLLCKLIPTTFQRACTMGTAGIWKLIMAAWSFENDLTVPDYTPSRRFVGGLSRLLNVGYVNNVVKLDYNSLYPSIMITWHVQTDLDVMNAMLSFLEFILTEREKFKGLKKEAGKKADKIANEIQDRKEEFKDGKNKDELIRLQNDKQHWDSEKNANDKKQLPFKIFGNSFFGSYGCGGGIFPWSDINCAEKTTCIGRQSLRLMISWFSNKNYQPIVGDSTTGDTPLFIKYKKDGLIDIKPISEIINEANVKIDVLGREYDYSEKPYLALSRNGWKEIEYTYRHKTEKDILTVKDKNMIIDVTEDHSLFDSDRKEIASKDIKEDTKLEYYEGEIKVKTISIPNNDEYKMDSLAFSLLFSKIDRVPKELLNSSNEDSIMFLRHISRWLWLVPNLSLSSLSKTAMAGLRFLEKKTNHYTIDNSFRI